LCRSRYCIAGKGQAGREAERQVGAQPTDQGKRLDKRRDVDRRGVRWCENKTTVRLNTI